jgi:hypothetical protein
VAQLCFEVGKRLVEQQRCGLDRHRSRHQSRHRDVLRRPAREFWRRTYYLSVMAGPQSLWVFHNDPAHEWMLRLP